LLCTTLASARAESSDKEARLAAAAELLQTTGARKTAEGAYKAMFDLMIPNVVAQMKQSKPNADPKAIDAFAQFFREELSGMMGKMLQPTIELYADKFTLDELRGLNQFYRSPLGQKVIQVQPSLVQAGVQTGKSIADAEVPLALDRALARLKAAGYTL
jgi:hypothetical protein